MQAPARGARQEEERDSKEKGERWQEHGRSRTGGRSCFGGSRSGPWAWISAAPLVKGEPRGGTEGDVVLVTPRALR
jgi:hypothetical protein